MFLLLPSPFYVGVEKRGQFLRVAVLRKRQDGWEIQELKEFSVEEIVNPLDKVPSDATITSSLSTHDVLVRSLDLPLKREKDIKAALYFQAEPMLPYPIEKCILQSLTIEKKEMGTQLVFASAKKESIQNHLNAYANLKLAPDCITCNPFALAAFVHFLKIDKEPLLVVHVGESEASIVLVEKGKLLASRSSEKNILEIQKGILSLSSANRGLKLDSILLLGEDFALLESIRTSVDKNAFYPSPSLISQENLHKFSLTIGMAISGLAGGEFNFRQNEFSSSRPLKKLRKPLIALILSSVFLTASVGGLTQFLLEKEQTKLSSDLRRLLSAIDRKQEIPCSPKEIQLTVDEIEKEIRSQPDTFALLPLVPKVSDILAWLSTHPQWNEEDKKNGVAIENFRYFFEKRPDFDSRDEHYCAKIELDLLTPNPTLARNFYETLTAPNPFVDAKKEIQWITGKGKYYISFYLKDKTRYR